MTILVSSVSDTLIVMLSDSTITTTHFVDEQGNYFNDYENGSKFYRFRGVGCITTWGDHTYNKLGQYLQRYRISADTHSVKDLAELTHKYIVEEYEKTEIDELGFHIGGFDHNGRPHLYHVFWGFDRPRPPEQQTPAHRLYDHSEWAFLYNGRNDLAHFVVSTLIKQIKSGEDTRFDLNTPVGRICFCDFIARFAAEMTPQVGPPFVTHLIFPDNSIDKVENTSFGPINVLSLASILPKIGTERHIKSTSATSEGPESLGWPTGTVISGLLDNDKGNDMPYSGGTISGFPPQGGG